MSNVSNNLTITEILSIIELCAKSGVSSIKYKELEVNYSSLGVNLTKEQHDLIEKATLANEEISSKKERLEMMLINNPLEYEELVSGEELVSDNSNADEEEDDDGV